MGEEWGGPSDQLEEGVIQEAGSTSGGSGALQDVSEEPAFVLDRDTLKLLDTPLQTRRETPDVQRLVVAFGLLQDNLRLLACEAAVRPALLELQIKLLAQDRDQIEKALDEKRFVEAWGVFNEAWVRFTKVVPLDQLSLLLSLRTHAKHKGGGVQNLIGWLDALRENAAMLGLHPAVDKAALRVFVVALEQGRAEIERTLAEGRFEQAWSTLRSFWETRLTLLPAENLEPERRAIELLLPSVGRGKRRDTLEKEIKKAEGWSLEEGKLPQLRSLLAWVKREINEMAQIRYWRLSIYQDRVKKTVRIMVAFLVALMVATVAILAWDRSTWYYQAMMVAGVVLAGGLGGIVSGLRRSEEIANIRLSTSYLKMYIAYLRIPVGAAAALAVYFLLDSGLLAVSFGSGSGHARELVYLALGFLSGFSERFFLEALDRVSASSVTAKPRDSQDGQPPESAPLEGGTDGGDVLPSKPGEPAPSPQQSPAGGSPVPPEDEESVPEPERDGMEDPDLGEEASPAQPASGPVSANDLLSTREKSEQPRKLG